MASDDDNRRRFDDDSEDEEDFNPPPADMSDDEGDADEQLQREARDSSPITRSRDDNDGDDESPVRTKSSSRRHSEDRDDEDEEEDEEDGPRKRRRLSGEDDDDKDEEEDDDDDDDDEDDVHTGRRKRRKDKRNAFFDIEAEVDDEDEGEDDERDGEEIEDFIDNAHPDDLADTRRLDDDRRHRELDRRREVEAGLDAEEQAEILRQRYGNRRTTKGAGDFTVKPKRLLLPSVDDPKIWAVKAREGKEREVVFAIMKRIEERIGTKNEILITSAFERGGPQSVMKGYIYVEAQRQPDVIMALDGIMNVYPRTKMELVDIKDMPDLLRIQKTPTLEPGAWVRLRKPVKHSGDLAQVLDVTENGLEARVKFIPRLDLAPRDDASHLTPDGKRKRALGPAPRPPQRFFNEAEVRKRFPGRAIQGSATSNVWTFMGDEFENGFQVKDIKIQQLQLTDVRPKLEEVTKFASGAEDGTENLDLKQLAASLKDANALTTYLPGDIIEVYEGEQRGVVGRATNVQGDIVTINVTEGALRGQTIEVPSRGLRKRFKVGDHVKVIGGSRYQDEVGMVVKISQDRVTLLADQSNTEITVFSKDLREADDIGGQGSIGNFELLDLVQIDSTTVGCVVKIDRESLVVLDQQGDTRQMVPSSIANKLTKKNTVAADRSGSEIRLGDVVKEYGGQQRRGKILHIWHGYVFLHTHDNNENSGVFVTRAASVNTVAAKGGRVNAPVGPDLTAMNPALKRNPNGNDPGKMLPPPKVFGRDKAIGQTVIIRRGGYKGLLGIVKDTTDASARVELHSKNKTITVPKDHLSFKDRHTGAKIDINSRGPRPYGGSQASDRRVPDWQSGGRTPAAGGLPERTPAWGGSGSRTPAFSGGRTPAWGRSGGDLGSRTPAWQDGSRTVYGQDGNRTSYGAGARTPAWQSGSKTPAIHDSHGAGSRTPAYASDSWGSGSKTPGYAGSAPTPAASGSDSWGYTPAATGGSHPYDAPTPGAGLLGAPTPGAALNAPTPGAYAAPTPAAVSAPTPGATWSGGWGDSAPTPAAGAPTPAASGFAGGYYGAPTPGAYGGAAETPAASGPRYTDDDDD